MSCRSDLRSSVVIHEQKVTSSRIASIFHRAMAYAGLIRVLRRCMVVTIVSACRFRAARGAELESKAENVVKDE